MKPSRRFRRGSLSWLRSHRSSDALGVDLYAQPRGKEPYRKRPASAQVFATSGQAFLQAMDKAQPAAKSPSTSEPVRALVLPAPKGLSDWQTAAFLPACVRPHRQLRCVRQDSTATSPRSAMLARRAAVPVASPLTLAPSAAMSVWRTRSQTSHPQWGPHAVAQPG